MKLLIIVIAVIILLGIILYKQKDIRHVKSDIDNNFYSVIDSGNKSEQFLEDSANTLAEVNKRVTVLIDHLNTKYSNNPDYYFVSFLKNDYDHSKILEAPIDNRYTSYTVDKEKIYICLRSRDSEERIYDINLLMYVILHELAHMCNYTRDNQPIEGHGIEFQQKFKFLTLEAININVYSYTDYRIRPQEYCGLLINSSIV